VEFENMTKIGCENEHFCKMKGGPFFKTKKMLIFKLILMFIFEKWKKNESKK